VVSQRADRRVATEANAANEHVDFGDAVLALGDFSSFVGCDLGCIRSAFFRPAETTGTGAARC
jgi:hypothetical protein